jgi:hypothetical protein
MSCTYSACIGSFERQRGYGCIKRNIGHMIDLVCYNTVRKNVRLRKTLFLKKKKKNNICKELSGNTGFYPKMEFEVSSFWFNLFILRDEGGYFRPLLIFLR